MKKFSLVVLLLSITVIDNLQARQDCACSHSFFSIRPPFQASTPERVTLFRDAVLRRDCGWGGAIQIVGFGGKSRRAKELAKFFTPNCSDTVIFEETNTETLFNPHARDVNAIFFNIRTADHGFKSSVKFRPRQTYGGVGLDWKQYFDWWRCDCPRLWLELSFPIEHVKNNMRLTENIISPGTPITGACDTFNSSVKQAFTGVNCFIDVIPAGELTAFLCTGTCMKFGLINGSRKKTGVADLEFRVGYDFVDNDCCHIDGYFGLVVPTGKKPKGKYVFEPIIGNNHHWGIMYGGSLGGVIWEGCDMSLRIEVEANGRYLFRNTQTRSFDVIGKPWSRYMSVYTSAANAAAGFAAPGINLFTQKVKVKPHAQQHLNAGLVYDWCAFEAEIGYHFWAASCEDVKLKNPFPTGLAFPNILGSDTNLPGFVNQCSLIKNNCTAFAVTSNAYSGPNTIMESDLDLNSAAMPCALSHMIYGSVGYNAEICCWPIFFGVGGSYEFTAKRFNTALNRWMIWGKVGVSI